MWPVSLPVSKLAKEIMSNHLASIDLQLSQLEWSQVYEKYYVDIIKAVENGLLEMFLLEVFQVLSLCNQEFSQINVRCGVVPNYAKELVQNIDR